MKIFNEISAVKRYILEKDNISLVPTMGYLHQGHISLIEKAKADGGHVIVSIFVNPTQFGPNEDLSRYPRDLPKDFETCKKSGAHAVFVPTPDIMYPVGYDTFLEVGTITNRLCGQFRPGHFRGVATICLKLFNITQAKRAYFGEKDAQQLLVIKKMVNDLNIPIEIIPCPTVREPDLLAKSSRNVYLSSEQRVCAATIGKAITAARQLVVDGVTDASDILSFIKQNLSPQLQIEYLSMVSINTMEDIQTVIPNQTLVAIAAVIGTTRLIDNFFA